MSVFIKQKAQAEEKAAKLLNLSPESLPKLLTTKQAGLYLGLSPHTLNTLRSRGGGPSYIKRGFSVRYTAEALDIWNEENSEVRTSTAQG